MAPGRKRIHKHFQLDPRKIKRAQKTLAKTETEECALDFAITEQEKNRLALEATDRFVGSGVEIRDVYGTITR